MREVTDRQKDRHTDTGDFIICPVLCYSNGTDNKKQNKNKKKQKNAKKTSAKHIRIRLLPEGGCVNYYYSYTVTVTSTTLTQSDII